MREKRKDGLPEVDPETNALATQVIGAAIEVHRILGAGFAESVYEEALCVELRLRGIPFERQVQVRISYKGHDVGTGRADLLVGKRLIVELKAVDSLSPVHLAQVLSYLKSTSSQLGLLINFNVTLLRDGVERVICSRSQSEGM